MVRMSAAELWELVRQEGALTPEVEAQLARERAEAIQILLSDLDNKDYLQMSVLFDDMTDEQVRQMLNSLNPLRQIGLISSLNPRQVERALPLIEAEEQRQLVRSLLAKQVQAKNGKGITQS
jgi:Mg/Co/Ni transporter MgtE